jgi:hypothetical protein
MTTDKLLKVLWGVLIVTVLFAGARIALKLEAYAQAANEARSRIAHVENLQRCSEMMAVAPTPSDAFYVRYIHATCSSTFDKERNANNRD